MYAVGSDRSAKIHLFITKMLLFQSFMIFFDRDESLYKLEFSLSYCLQLSFREQVEVFLRDEEVIIQMNHHFHLKLIKIFNFYSSKERVNLQGVDSSQQFFSARIRHTVINLYKGSKTCKDFFLILRLLSTAFLEMSKAINNRS